MRHPTGAAAALLFLAWSLTACSGTGGGLFERCVPAEGATASTFDLEGSYTGSLDAEGVRLTLVTSPGEIGGKLTVQHWPTGKSFRSELGASFDTTGTWQLEMASASVKHPMVRLYFDPPKPGLPIPDSLDRLSVGIDEKRTFLYDNADPDTCPDFRLQRHQG
ncbi:hypothetical protein [Streptomyces sp. NPDC047718]|uniref:hypothetical protein n=1 Tax=Streptomyces sp. NPDC047718 TaxID=3155479 RepID=UPI0034035477